MANGRLAQSRVGVLGTGEVGRRLAAGFRSRGHDVMIGCATRARPSWSNGSLGRGPASNRAPSPRLPGARSHDQPAEAATPVVRRGAHTR